MSSTSYTQFIWRHRWTRTSSATTSRSIGIVATAVNFELKCKQQKESIDDIVDVLLGKAEAYQDTDFYRMAVRLTSEKHVVMRKMEMNLPLWDEDKEFIKENLK